MPDARSPAALSSILSTLRRAFWVGILCLLGVAGALAILAGEAGRSAQRVEYERDVGRVAREALGLALEQESALRRTRPSPEARSLPPEISARVALRLKLDTLRALTADDPVQQSNARAIDMAVTRWAREVAESPIRPGPNAMAIPDHASGTRPFDPVRAAFAAFLVAEDSHYDERVRVERAVHQALQVTIALALLLLLGIFLRFRAHVHRQARGLLDQQELLEGQAVELELQAEALRAQTAELIEQTNAAQRSASELANQRRFLREVIDTIPTFVFAKDRDGRFTLANRSLAEEYGTTVEAIIGRSEADYNSNAEKVAACRLAELAVIESGRDLVVPEELVTDATGAERWFETVKRPLASFSPDGTLRVQVLGVATDITARKRAEAAVRTSEQRLRQGQKMEAVGRLAGGIAHDFNNVLTVIKSCSEFLLEDLGASHPHRNDVEEITSAANRATRLIRQLLAFSRQQVLQPRALDLNATVRALAPMLGRLLGAGVRLDVRLDERLGIVRADPSQLEQVLVNLAVNARDAMPNGGLLTIETSNVELDHVHSSGGMALQPGPYVLLAVSDTGTGMNSETRTQMFEPFFTTKEVGEGTGLGLATVYGIVEQSGGYVEVESELGQGAAFRIYLPLVYEAIDDGASTGEELADTGLGASAATILLVEDDASVRAAARRTLLRAGHLLLEAGNGAEALALCSAPAGPRIDLVVTDLVMPVMGGLELGAQLRTVRPGLAIMYMSGYSRDAIRRQSVLDAGITFVEKPFTPQAFLRSVRAALAGADSRAETTARAT